MTKFYFYSGSADKPPGQGVNEELSPNESVETYKDLLQISNWRKILSNFYDFPMTINDLQWATVEHYYQANKFKVNNPDFYKQFTINCSNFSTNPISAKSAGGKSGGVFRPKNIIMDADFFPDRQKICMLEALNAKFSQVGLPKDVLLATGNAELWHGTRGVAPSRQYLLEEVRNNIRGYKYLIEDIYNYDENELDNFISQLSDEKYTSIYDKRYITIYYLLINHYFNDNDEKLLSNNINKLRELLETSDTAKIFRSKLI